MHPTIGEEVQPARSRPAPALLRFAAVAAAAIAALLVCAPFALLALPFALVSAATRAVARRIEPRIAPWREMIEFCPRIGWRPRPNLDVHGLADEIFRATTDSRGWRGRGEVGDSDMVVFGDSFAFGYGVNDADFFAARTVPRIKAVGAPGYNMIQELLLMREMAPDFRGKPVVWFVYHGNDLFENLVPNLWEYRMPFAKGGNGAWEIVTAHLRREPWPIVSEPQYFRRLAEMCCAGPESDRAYDACRYLLAQGRDLCASIGSVLAVVTVPDIYQMRDDRLRRLRQLAPDVDSFDPLRPDRAIGGICRDLQLPFVALMDHLGPKDYKPVDSHWNEQGHRRVGRVLDGLHERLRAGGRERVGTGGGPLQGVPAGPGDGGGTDAV